MSSRPGALYTVFIDPAGFNWNGTWAGSTPGNNLAINNVPANGTFSATDQAEISAIYASLANKYRSFNVNVTTVDPAVTALGTSVTDAQRQDYYDSQAHMMHTIVGPAGTPGWHGIADGLAAGDISVVSSGGGHTNWMFTEGQDGSPTIANGTYIGGIDAHETGHTFGLSHQSDYTGMTYVNEYAEGDATGGNGSYSPIMGAADSFGRQRVTWRVGNSANGTTDNGTGTPIENQQNDVKTILSKDGAALVNSGIGHTFVTATPLPLVGTAINVNSPLDSGVISPLSATNPNPIGVGNYTQDIFSFLSDGTTPISLTVNDGNDLLSPGTADPGATLRSTLSIFNSSNTLVGTATGTEDASTLFESYNGLLGAGSYYAEIKSYGGHNEVSDSNATGTFNPAQYYDLGGYFLTGSGFAAVPEPTTLSLLALSGLGLLRRRRVARI